MKHYLVEIRRNHPALSAEIRQHALGCALCRREIELYDAVAAGVASLPRRAVPARLKELVFERLARPAYRAWHLAAALVFAWAAPLLFQQLGATRGIAANWLPALYASFGLLNLLLIFAVAFHLFSMHRRGVIDVEKRLLDALEAPGRFWSRLRRP
ncbi:MAG: hypothetical protein K1X75_01515 [Leptospirales bacterium]|nr:hypothetical protein [Leptospirales bacterium]